VRIRRDFRAENKKLSAAQTNGATTLARYLAASMSFAPQQSIAWKEIVDMMLNPFETELASSNTEQTVCGIGLDDDGNVAALQMPR
jgi:hypothetical protein